MNQLALELGHRSARLASEKADRIHDEWTLQALGFLKNYAALHSEFQCLHVRLYAENRGLPVAPDPRAWGHVLILAAKLNLIKDTGRMEKTDHKKSHGRKQTVWKSILLI